MYPLEILYLKKPLSSNKDELYGEDEKNKT